MNFTYRNNVWKPSATNSIVPTNARPHTPSSRIYGKPNPLKVWRKQLQPAYPTISSKQIAIRNLESAVYVGDQTIDCDNNYQLLKENITPDLPTCDGVTYVDDNGKKTCRGGTNKVRRSGTTKLSNNYCSSHKQLLRDAVRHMNKIS